jgi:hypothetical protein
MGKRLIQFYGSAGATCFSSPQEWKAQKGAGCSIDLHYLGYSINKGRKMERVGDFHGFKCEGCII